VTEGICDVYCKFVNRCVTEWERRREILKCAEFSVMVRYRVGEREGNGDVCCN